ncbi:dienelactone hydrolase family protein [Bacillus sp. NP157]|nr:dienelactone hydrolase family protein [Bacillus sp. NP157]
MRKCVATILATALCLISGIVSADGNQFRFLDEPGPLPVGLRIENKTDPSRPFRPNDASAHTVPRPYQILVWYPAAAVSGTPLTVGDYAALFDTELDASAPGNTGSRWRRQLASTSAVRLRAAKNAAPAMRRFPVVVYTPSDSSVSWESADVCEYLASHGYVVVASPSMGEASRDMTDDLPGIRAQARDVSFLIDYATSLRNTDASRVAAMGFSWGGLANLFAAVRDPRIKALVSMEGSERYFPGLVKHSGDVDPARMRIPLLYFTESDANLLERLDKYDDSPATDRTGPNVLNAWTQGDLVTATMLGMSHGEFSAMFQRRKSDADFAEDQVADYGREDVNTSYALVARYALAFLDASLKGKGDRAELGKTRAPPAHFLGMTFRKATAPEGVTDR